MRPRSAFQVFKFGLRMDMKFLLDWKKLLFNNNNKRYLRLLKKERLKNWWTGKMIMCYVTVRHCLHGYLTFCGQVYSFNSLLYPEMHSKSTKVSISAVILIKVNHKLKTVMLDSLNINVFLSSRLL